jgi:2-oxo-4-hydroxy-4-carboxy-5-ureidoimidazoline decarboxylase
MITVAALDRSTGVEARELLRSCCGATRWVEGMLSRRPFGTMAGLLESADAVWRDTGPADWEEAFAHHPRIGESESGASVGAGAAGFSAKEQSAATRAPPELRSELAAANREYERRFGRIFIVRAAGRSAEELLRLLKARLSNPPEQELRIAAAEQGAILRLRLAALFTDQEASTS